MKIEIDIERTQQKVIATLAEDNPSALAFYQQLPLTLTLKDYAGAEKISPALLKPLPSNTNGYEGKQGDITYYAPWGNLAIFYRDSAVGYATGLIYLGKVEQNLAALDNLNGEKVTIRQVK
ncbi:hypothetical protein QS62_04305 [Gallibacterium salpingitidis]|uniref:Cyclophilin-like domain-containing protein n=2 Tax=Gallibacterium salpingitidis TaxID=505341 RepID=A0A1A7P0E2_9PAST|nr:hypothetical protein QS62_04305 [Gallibacterium salpingitidis]